MFQEQWTLRALRGEPPRLPHGDALYDSAAVPHDTRCDLPLPDRRATLTYMETVLDTVAGRLAAATDLRDDEIYFHLLALNHEDMHAEAFIYTRQALGYPPPSLPIAPRPEAPAAARGTGDIHIPGGHVLLGAPRGPAFVIDNEKWEHPVHLPPFAIARAAVTQGEFAQFVDDGGYLRREWCMRPMSLDLSDSPEVRGPARTSPGGSHIVLAHPFYWAARSPFGARIEADPR